MIPPNNGKLKQNYYKPVQHINSYDKQLNGNSSNNINKNNFKYLQINCAKIVQKFPVYKTNADNVLIEQCDERLPFLFFWLKMLLFVLI